MIATMTARLPRSVHRRLHRHPEAYSLIELLVAITIIAVLGIFAVTSIRASREAALQAASINQLRQIGVACFAYAADHNSRLPVNTNTDGSILATHGPGMTKGAAPRKLFSRYDWPGMGDGYTNYLASPDALYSPFARAFASRTKDQFYTVPVRRIGYVAYTTVLEDTLGRLPNWKLNGDPRAILYSDFYSKAMAQEYDYTSSFCTFLYLDGTVRKFTLEEIDSYRQQYPKHTVGAFAAEFK